MIIINILSGFLGISLIILIHEFGHLYIARKMGIDVEVFSIGFGPRIIQFKRKQTEYRLSIIPFGGYCKMKGGMEVFAQSTHARKKGDFYAARPIQRIATLLGGPGANLIFSFLVFAFVAVIGQPIQTFENRIVLFNDVFPEDNTITQVAAEAGLQTGDVIMAINDREVNYFSDISEIVSASAEKPLNFRIYRNEQLRNIIVSPSTTETTGRGQIGVFPWVEPEISHVIKGTPADAAGFQPGDTILEMNGDRINHAWDILRIIHNGSTTQVYEFTVIQNNKQQQIRMVSPTNDLDNFSLIGLEFKHEILNDRKNIADALLSSIYEIRDMLSNSMIGIKSIIAGEKLSEIFAGPIRITYFTGQLLSANTLNETFGMRIIRYIHFLGIISVAILFMNMLPIPLTDGGQTLLFLYEMILKKFPSQKFVFYYHATGGVIILLLAIVVLWGDFRFLMG